MRERMVCSACEGIFAVVTPPGGDGSVMMPWRHRVGGQVCPGTYREALPLVEETEPDPADLYPEDRVRCSIKGCRTSYSKDMWSSIKATEAGWFQQKDLTAFCPEHVPDWVPAWRAKQRGQS